MEYFHNVLKIIAFILRLYFCFLLLSDSLYPDRESNSELSFRRALLYPFNYQGVRFSAAKVRRKDGKTKYSAAFLSILHLPARNQDGHRAVPSVYGCC